MAKEFCLTEPEERADEMTDNACRQLSPSWKSMQTLTGQQEMLK